ncbi:hypothetical protein ACFQJ7_01790 [Halovenus rubra]|uniref:Uncharacterized protein n=2 Tax=Halovenus rubra TaxID=869890 RepID=A0ACC7E226_9EURY|nr:hypothetical protein [Halovenus rubra]
MLLVRGKASGTELTGTIYEKGEEPPQYSGSPDDDAPYVWVCDEFYEVDSGGSTQVIGDREIQIAFETPMPRGFKSRNQALERAKEHVRTQFARLGVDPEAVVITVLDAEEVDD